MKLSILALPVIATAAWLVPEAAQAASCDWTVNGTVSVDHEEQSFRDALGSNSTLEGINVKVSARTKVAGRWATWKSWGTVRTSSNGYFSVRKSKNCVKRQFRVQVEFKDPDLEMRHERSTTTTEKVKWYKIYEYGGSGRSAGTLSLGNKRFKGSGSYDLDNREARSHASIWVVAQDAQDYMASLGSAYAFTSDIRIKYPHNSRPVPDDKEESYANPTTKVIYIHKSQGKDRLDVNTVLHEMGHIWAYNHSSGEICLTETLLINGDTHDGVEDPCVAFHEGFAEFWAEEVARALYGGAKTLPYSRRKLVSKDMGTAALVERTDDGWTSALHMLTTRKIHEYNVGTKTTGPGNVITKASTVPVACVSPSVSFKDVLRTFNANPSKGYANKLSRSETTMRKFFDRVGTINSSISDAKADRMREFSDPEQSIQPQAAMCAKGKGMR